jgi:hypothetical protein
MASADDTVSGQLSRAGDEARVGAWTLRVADTDGRRILRILAVRPA